MQLTQTQYFVTGAVSGVIMSSFAAWQLGTDSILVVITFILLTGLGLGIVLAIWRPKKVEAFLELVSKFFD